MSSTYKGRSEKAAADARAREQRDRALADRLARAGVPMFPAGRPVLTAISTDGRVRNLGPRTSRWQLFEKASVSAAAELRDAADDFEKKYKSKCYRHFTIRPDWDGDGNPIPVDDYRTAHSPMVQSIADSLEYLESIRAAQVLLVVAHPRVCDEHGSVDPHVHVVASVKPNNLDTVIAYLKKRHGDVWTHSRGSKRNFGAVAHYIRKNVSSPGIGAITDDTKLRALYEQTHGLHYVFPRGRFRRFLAKWRRARKHKSKRKRSRQHQPKHGSRFVGVAMVWLAENECRHAFSRRIASLHI
jgi:hypothetical protein